MLHIFARELLKTLRNGKKNGISEKREYHQKSYRYDKRGQLLGVYDKNGFAVEEYVYDPAGNILKKTLNGKTTTYTYDKANQLVSSVCDGKVTKYEYDAAGRLVKEGDKTYSYIGLDKIESVTEGGRKLSSFTYHIDGQLAARVGMDSREDFTWDGLALIQRNNVNYVNEPAVTGGNPILADDSVLFNDMLGTTLGVKEGDQFASISRDAFGMTESKSAENFFTGKPHVGEMGYVFLFRNYRADQGKWQTSDPLGYPDGWNNLAYCNNGANYIIDPLGLSVWQWLKESALALLYGRLYVEKQTDITGLVTYYILPDVFALTSEFSASVLSNHAGILSLTDTYYDTCFSELDGKDIGTYSMSKSSPILIDLGKSNAILGSIVGSGYLNIAGIGNISKNEQGKKVATVSLTIQYTDIINWNSKQELNPGYFDPSSPLWVKASGYTEVILSNIANAGSYNINTIWNASKSKVIE